MESIGDSFLTQVIENLMKGDALLDLVYTNKRELVRNIKVRATSLAVTMRRWAR